MNTQTENLLHRLIASNNEQDICWPTLANSTLVKEVTFEKTLRERDVEIECQEFWSIYICHNPCHGDLDDRHTVWACRQSFWGQPFTGDLTFRVIGRELPYAFALKLAQGNHPQK